MPWHGVRPWSWRKNDKMEDEGRHRRPNHNTGDARDGNHIMQIDGPGTVRKINNRQIG